MEFTKEQIENWKAYENVRQSGLINMWDSVQGSTLSGLTQEDYRFSMRNYSALKEAAEK